MSETADTPEASVPQNGGFGWKSLLRGATIAAILVTIVILVLAGLIPPLIVFIVLWAIGLWWVRRPGKGGPIFLLVIFIAFLVTNAPFVVPQLQVPASTIDFVIALGSTLAGLTAVVAAIGVLVQRDAPSGVARALGGIVVGLFIAGVALSVVQNTSFENAELQEGDVELTTVDIEFSPSDIEAGSGTAVFITNDDPVLHTFTIDELDIDEDIPAGKTVRVVIDAEAGTYRFYCVPHQPDMEGELTVR